MTVHPGTRLLVLPLAIVVGAAAMLVTLLSAPAHAASSTAATVKLGRSDLGRMLVDGRGRTLYLFEKDKNGRSSCTGACAGFWPPLLTTAKPHAGTGVRQSLLGTTKRADGKLQVTYAHHPLYRFALDTKAGQTKGEGLAKFGAEWYMVSAAGKTIEDDESSGGGYGYGG